MNAGKTRRRAVVHGTARRVVIVSQDSTGPFEQAIFIIRDGSAVSEAELLREALDAAEALEAEGVSCSVVDMFCVKPLDEELVLSEAAGKKLVVTFENHGVIGGLGDAVAATLAEAGAGVKLVRHGVKERFGQVGDPAWLQKDFHLTADDLVASVKGGLA